MKLNTAVKNIDWPDKVFSVTPENFEELALAIFQFQHEFNPVYNQYCRSLHIDIANITSLEKIPFLPISFFKTHTIKTTDFEAEVIFESSGTTKTINSKHHVKSIDIYQESFTRGFDLFYDADHCIIALLPSYLERNNSSLVMMVDKLITASNHPRSGFYLHDLFALQETILALEKEKQKTLLIGATFALLDFAEQFPMSLQYTTIMETGGMKGRRKEITRAEVHEILCNSFHAKKIHSEYGMTELLSQAYSKGDGIFNCPPWMKILVREDDDPFSIQSASLNKTYSGAVNIIDLANIYSCSFIAAEDAGKLYPDGSVEIIGRLDNSDIRGCSLLTL
ncbi:acyl transferase [Ferruginibacter lapsinanis]|uniref:acyl transferase n=1 Tax=Ferruginibacter lapsinanis TaxID=563172 RepID=UPI001E4D9D98|nr:acyl transferase [Ferruginibacter lapsinanis]UEG49696.1 acyl transferase [Ferruginibacter lapsinanis]